MNQTLVIRADANVAMGTGHVMRCLALAQAWQDFGGTALFAMAQSTPAVNERLNSEGFEIVRLNGIQASAEDAVELAKLALAGHADWVVVDGYQFDADYQHRVKDAELRLLLFDDNAHGAHYFADLILNQNPYANESLYRSCASDVRLLLGPHYALLRREFQSWRNWNREISPAACKVLVMMGGSDPDNITALVIHALRMVNVPGLEAKVVAGGSNPHMESLERAAAQSTATLSLLRNPSNMPELMSWADVAVSAAGSTCWEMCLLGLPAILIDLATNQRPVAQELDRMGVAIHLGGTSDLSPEGIAGKLSWLLGAANNRAEMSRRAREVVDGEGARRVIAAMRSRVVRIRPIEEEDCRLLWEWANAPEVREVSFSTQPIAWEQHVEWFNAKRADAGAVLYIAVDAEGVPVGQVRYQIEGTRAVVSISLATQYRGKGHGKAALSSGIEALFQNTNVSTIDAYVKPHNHAGVQLFTRAMFQREGMATIQGQEAVHFVLNKGRST